MPERESIDYSKDRKKVAEIYKRVLAKQISIKNALIIFPKDSEDITIDASFHALCHLEADEDIRAKDVEYAKEQDEYIKYIMSVLEKGEALPENIIKSYIPYHPYSLISGTNTIKNAIKGLKRFLNC